MKAWFAMVLLIGLASMAAFGAVSMSHHGGGTHGCAAAIATGNDCLNPQDALAFIGLHIKAFTSYAAGGASLALAFLILAAGIAAMVFSDSPRLAPTRAVHLRRAARHPLQHKQRLDAWLALTTRRDPDLS